MAKTRTNLTDLNEYLFEALDRLTNDNLTDEELEKEIQRSKAVTDVADTIIANGTLALQVSKHMYEYGHADSVELPMIGYTNSELEKSNQDKTETIKHLQARIKKYEGWDNA